MTLLTICQAVADDIGLDNQPASIIGNPDPDAQRMLRFANRVCVGLATSAPWQALRREAVFTSVAAELQPNVFPSGFNRMATETLWDRTNRMAVAGQIGPAEYQSKKALGGYGGPMRWFTRRDNDMLIWPMPDAGQTYAFEYQSMFFCRSSGGTDQTEWLADTDLGNLPEELITLGIIARFLEAENLPRAAVARLDFNRRMAEEIRADRNSPDIMMAGDVFGGYRRFSGEPGVFGSYGYYW